jgi:glucan phosphorylase
MDFLKKLSYNEIDGNPIMDRVIKRLEEMWENFDDMLYYDVEKLRKAADDEAMKETIEKQVAEKVEKREKEITQKVTDEVTQKVTDEVTVAIALKMIKDGLSKQQVINYLQITEEEYETLKRKVFDK